MTVKVEFSINTVKLEVKYFYNHLNAVAICLRTSATQFSATTLILTLEPTTGRKSETAIARNIIRDLKIPRNRCTGTGSVPVHLKCSYA